jgi:hypothetical protein
MQETIAKLSDEQKAEMFPPIERKNFVVRKSWYGRNQIISFKNKNGKTITYNHDIALEIMKPRLAIMPAWDKYGYWSQSTDIPLSLRYRDLLNRPETTKKPKAEAKPKAKK